MRSEVMLLDFVTLELKSLMNWSGLEAAELGRSKLHVCDFVSTITCQDHFLRYPDQSLKCEQSQIGAGKKLRY